jgi:hypothetical protein
MTREYVLDLDIQFSVSTAELVQQARTLTDNKSIEFAQAGGEIVRDLIRDCMRVNQILTIPTHALPVIDHWECMTVLSGNVVLFNHGFSSA